MSTLGCRLIVLCCCLGVFLVVWAPHGGASLVLHVHLPNWTARSKYSSIGEILSDSCNLSPYREQQSTEPPKGERVAPDTFSSFPIPQYCACLSLSLSLPAAVENLTYQCALQNELLHRNITEIPVRLCTTFTLYASHTVSLDFS